MVVDDADFRGAVVVAPRLVGAAGEVPFSIARVVDVVRGRTPDGVAVVAGFALVDVDRLVVEVDVRAGLLLMVCVA